MIYFPIGPVKEEKVRSVCLSVTRAVPLVREVSTVVVPVALPGRQVAQRGPLTALKGRPLHPQTEVARTVSWHWGGGTLYISGIQWGKVLQ